MTRLEELREKYADSGESRPLDPKPYIQGYQRGQRGQRFTWRHAISDLATYPLGGYWTDLQWEFAPRSQYEQEQQEYVNAFATTP